MNWKYLIGLSILALSCGQTSPDGALDVKLGGDFGCVLDPGNGVYCWGSNSHGQLAQTPPKFGLESGVRESVTPVLVAGTQDAIELSVGDSHACVLTPDDVLCWGSDEQGQIGVSIPDACEGSATHIGNFDVACQPAATSLGLGKQNWLSAGGEATCVGSGTDTTCRGNSNYRFDKMNGLNSIGMNWESACGLTSLGKLRCDKRPSVDEYGVVESIGSIESFALGNGTTVCTINSSRALKCWGSSNSLGELGAGHTDIVNPWESTSPVPSAVQVVSGGTHYCALSGTGDVHCWGQSTSGQIGVAPILASGGVEMTDPDSYQPPSGLCPGGACEPTPIRVEGIGGATRIAAGASTSCAITEDDQVKCWGRLVDSTVPTVIDGPWSHSASARD
jgi:hypothetical protein